MKIIISIINTLFILIINIIIPIFLDFIMNDFLNDFLDYFINLNLLLKILLSSPCLNFILQGHYSIQLNYKLKFFHVNKYLIHLFFHYYYLKIFL